MLCPFGRGHRIGWYSDHMTITVRGILLGRLLALAILAALVAISTPALATGESSTETDTESDAPAVDAPTPAIEIPEDAPEAIVAEWPYRFLVPATIVLGSLAVIGTILMYFVRVTKNRYRVIE